MLNLIYYTDLSRRPSATNDPVARLMFVEASGNYARLLSDGLDKVFVSAPSTLCSIRTRVYRGCDAPKVTYAKQRKLTAAKK